MMLRQGWTDSLISTPPRLSESEIMMKTKIIGSNKVFGIITDHITDSLSLEATKTESRHADHDSHLAALQSTVHSTAHCTPLHIESSMSPRVAAAPRP